MSLKEALFVVENKRWKLPEPLPETPLAEPMTLRHDEKPRLITVHGSPGVQLGFGALGSLLKQAMA
jgi:hypothetical protein